MERMELRSLAPVLARDEEEEEEEEEPAPPLPEAAGVTDGEWAPSPTHSSGRKGGEGSTGTGTVELVTREADSASGRGGGRL